MSDRTVWVLGDQLGRHIGALADADPARDTILLVEADDVVTSKSFHRQRIHLVLTAMRRFARELAEAGFIVDHRRAPSMRAGFERHVDEHAPEEIVATEPNSRAGHRLMEALGVTLVRSNQFLTHPVEFAEWADGRSRIRMEDFYRHQRRRLGYLMDGDEPAGGEWNLDDENREPPPEDTASWPHPPTDDLDDVDRETIAAIPDGAHGHDPVGLWPTDRAGALRRLDDFVARRLHRFGRYEDAMSAENWHMAHSLLSPALNLGLLAPAEVCDAVEEAYRRGDVPLNSAEGMIRQVIGWREYVWGLYWLWPDHSKTNELGNDMDLPPVFTGEASTDMRCVDITMSDLDQRGWVHHIPRLMILSNLSNLLGVHPRAVSDWMWSRYIDGAEWVMIPNVFGMGMWADGGRMATKPYVSGGAYIDRMSDHCRPCRFDPSERTGDDACPFTSMYWGFVARHADRLESNHRMAMAVRSLERLSDRESTIARADEVREAILRGEM